MKKNMILLSLIREKNSEKFIKNINIPVCKNCIYYKPGSIDFYSEYSRCNKFGEKDIITGKITYDFADSCRNNESKCGKEGKYFEEEKNIYLKKIKYFMSGENIYYPIFAIPFVVLLFELGIAKHLL